MTSSQRDNSFHFVQNTLRILSGIAQKLCSRVIFVDNLIFRHANAGSERFLNLFLFFLRWFRERKQILSEPVVLNPVMKFVQIKGDRQNKIFCSDVFCASHKESFKSVILFSYSEHTFCLYGSVYPELNTFFWNDILSAFFSEIIESLTNLNTLWVGAFITLTVIRTAFAGFTTVDFCFALISCISYKVIESSTIVCFKLF